MTSSFIVLILIFFVYGLAFFSMGLAIAIESRRTSAFPLARSLKYLAAFGLIHSGVEWLDMLVLIETHSMPDADVTAWRVSRVVLLAISALCLLVFSAQVLTNTLQRFLWLRFVPAGLFIIWLASFVLPHLGWVAGDSSLGSSTCLQCHQGQSHVYVSLSGEWVTSADVWARYLLYFPGSVLAGLAIASQRKLFKFMGVPRITKDCGRAAVAFFANAFLGGLIVTPAPYFPASVLNYASFFAWLHVPPQIFRAALAIISAYAILRILRVFEYEQRTQLDLANRERFEAQQSSLEAQRQAREDIERSNRQLEDTVHRRTRELEALFKIGNEISALLDVDKILSSVVENARQLLNSEVSTLSLVDEESGELVVRAVAGMRTEAFAKVRMPVGSGMAGRAVAIGRPVAVSDYRVDPSITHELDAVIEAEGLLGHLAVPLHMGDKIIGALYVADRQPRDYSEADGRLLARFANQASIAIENARLYLQVQNLAILVERDRLAREMHDSLAQSLGYLSMKANFVATLLDKGDDRKAMIELRDMERAADDAYADVRESILGLRSTVSPGRGLKATLTEYLRKFGLQNHIHTELVVADGTALSFPPAIEVQVVRIIQEALANVRKHAKATSVSVHFSRAGGCAELSITDNGRGFDPLGTKSRTGDHFGLQTMRERAESVGGQIEVRSTPGSGTQIIVRFSEELNGGKL